jgi:hypothetical protein
MKAAGNSVSLIVDDDIVDDIPTGAANSSALLDPLFSKVNGQSKSNIQFLFLTHRRDSSDGKQTEVSARLRWS